MITRIADIVAAFFTQRAKAAAPSVNSMRWAPSLADAWSPVLPSRQSITI
jgi:hypothetical protein